MVWPWKASNYLKIGNWKAVNYPKTDHWSSDFPEFSCFCICGSSAWASVIVWPWKAVNYLKIGHWSLDFPEFPMFLHLRLIRVG